MIYDLSYRKCKYNCYTSGTLGSGFLFEDKTVLSDHSSWLKYKDSKKNLKTIASIFFVKIRKQLRSWKAKWVEGFVKAQ